MKQVLPEAAPVFVDIGFFENILVRKRKNIDFFGRICYNKTKSGCTTRNCTTEKSKEDSLCWTKK